MIQNSSIKDAADRTGLNYENAKVIYRIFRLEQRVNKKERGFVCEGRSKSALT